MKQLVVRRYEYLGTTNQGDTMYYPTFKEACSEIGNGGMIERCRPESIHKTNWAHKEPTYWVNRLDVYCTFRYNGSKWVKVS
jgi:hypothetical protein